MSAAEELEAAARGAIAAGLPYVFTASFDTAGRTMMGLTPESLGGARRTPCRASPSPTAPIAASAPAISSRPSWRMSAAAPDDVLVAKGNCGIPTLVGDKVHYGGTPELMADYARLARDSGARIIGGCCGTSPVAHRSPCARRSTARRRASGRRSRPSRRALGPLHVQKGQMRAPVQAAEAHADRVHEFVIKSFTS